MAFSAARSHGNLVSILRSTVSNLCLLQKVEKTAIVCGCSYIQTRKFRPYSVIPKKYLKRKNRDKKDRDDVYFLTDQVDPTYSVDDAVNMIKAYDLFGNEKLDLLLNMNLGEGKNKVAVLKGLVHLPTPVTESQKVLVFAEGEDAVKAKRAGATFVGGKELISKVEEGELEFDHCISTLDFLPNIKHLPKILRNKMPNTRRGTATNDIEEALKIFSHGETYMADNTGKMRQTIALSNFSKEEIEGNLKEIMKAVDSHKKAASLTTEKFYKHVSLALPAGPKIDLKISEVTPV
ncbi:large ribosomal subunit protein uL1-like isoform X1 [Clytia hemisphaerica]|uniref:39S ribosomal protein L1, mitochondrial n=1 Tax=Clytia hemisphaerica TaxID=252671 RepID=A0A7M5XHU6_9CNID|eukprot:TCONS_00004930-protein